VIPTDQLTSIKHKKTASGFFRNQSHHHGNRFSSLNPIAARVPRAERLVSKSCLWVSGKNTKPAQAMRSPLSKITPRHRGMALFGKGKWFPTFQGSPRNRPRSLTRQLLQANRLFDGDQKRQWRTSSQAGFDSFE